jgi:hypothetical protein
LPAPALAWQWDVNESPAAMPATMISAKSMKAPAQIARVHAKPRTGVWPQQVVVAPGVAFSVAMAPSRGSFDRQMTKPTLSRPSGARRTGGWSSGDLLRG